MPTTSKNFQELASEAADKLFDAGTSLDAAVAEVATREKLNPEEVRRLVEKTNVVATVKMLRASTDRKATIDLAEYETVLGKTHPTAEAKQPDTEVQEDSAQEKTAVLRENRRNAFMDLQDIFKLHGQTKVAGEYKRNMSHVAVFHKRRELEEAKLQKSACEMLVKDAIDFLASEFSKYNGPCFEKFATEAITLHGGTCLPILKSLAGYLRCPLTLNKTADYIVDDTTALHKKLAEVCTGVAKILACDAQVAKLSEDLRQSWSAAVGR